MGDAPFGADLTSFLPLSARRRRVLVSERRATLLPGMLTFDTAPSAIPIHHALVFFFCFCHLFDCSGDGPSYKRSVGCSSLSSSARFAYICRLASQRRLFSKRKTERSPRENSTEGFRARQRWVLNAKRDSESSVLFASNNGLSDYCFPKECLCSARTQSHIPCPTCCATSFFSVDK